MTSIRDLLSEQLDEGALFLGSQEGEFDSAITGVITRDGITVVLYDESKVIDCLVMQGMTEEEAWDWWGFNIEGAYMGPHTPAYCRTLQSLGGT